MTAQLTLDTDLSTSAGHERSARNLAPPGLRVGGYLTIQQRFEEWLETTPGRLIYREFVERAHGMRRRGWRRYSHKAIVEAIRYETDLELGPNDGGFKINDHFSSRMARRAMAQHPLLEGLFELRELRA